MHNKNMAFRRDSYGDAQGVKIAIIIIACMAVPIILYGLIPPPPPPPYNMEMRIELKDDAGIAVLAFKSNVSTINLTITLKDSKGSIVDNAIIQLIGCNVSMVLVEKDGYYVNPTPITPILRPDDINGEITVIASAQDRDKCTRTILVVR